jgi:hypothetical protein
MKHLGQLVNFPGAKSGITSGGDNGMFVVMAVPEPEGWTQECTVDVSLVLTEPDVCVSPEGRDLWGRESGYPDNTSVPMLAAVHMGSSDMAYYDEVKDEYWAAQESDLTEAGMAIMRALFCAYGVAPVLLTFLDT